METNRRDFLKGGLAGAFGAFLTWAGVARAEEAVVEDIAPYADFHAKLDDLARRVVEASARHKTLYPEEYDGSFDGVSDNVSWDYRADTGGARIPDSPGYTYCGAVGTGIEDPFQVFWDDTLGSDENGVGTYADPVATYACARSIADSLGNVVI